MSNAKSPPRAWLVGVMGALAMGLAGEGQAAVVYDLIFDCAGGCGLQDYGTVTVDTSHSIYTELDVNLAPGVIFNTVTKPDAFAFNIAGNSPNAVVGVDGSLFDGGTETPQAHPEGAFGNFEYDVDWDTFRGQGHTSNSLTVKISSNSAGVNFGGNTEADGAIVLFTADIEATVGSKVYYGVVGAGVPPPPPVRQSTQGVPEPTVWALMLTGFFGAGAALRRKRGQQGV